MNVTAAWDFIDSMMGVDYGYEVCYTLFVCCLLDFLPKWSSLQMIYPPSVLQVVLTGLIDTLYDNMPCANKVWNSVFKWICYLLLLREAPTVLSLSTWSCWWAWWRGCPRRRPGELLWSWTTFYWQGSLNQRSCRGLELPLTTPQVQIKILLRPESFNCFRHFGGLLPSSSGGRGADRIGNYSRTGLFLNSSILFRLDLMLQCERVNV